MLEQTSKIQTMYVILVVVVVVVVVVVIMTCLRVLW
jgi:hypothetical protein